MVSPHICKLNDDSSKAQVIRKREQSSQQRFMTDQVTEQLNTNFMLVLFSARTITVNSFTMTMSIVNI